MKENPYINALFEEQGIKTGYQAPLFRYRIESRAATKCLPGLCTVINGIDMKRKKYGYYYGYGKYGKYGKYYGYGRKYGYGYGYGDSGHAAK